MAKTHDDEEFEAGVHEAQREGLVGDVVHGMVKDSSPRSKGYEYGAKHRYGSKGRYHTWSGSGANDPKSNKTSKSEKGSNTSQREHSDPYFWGKDNDRSYTTRDKYSNGSSSSQLETKPMPALIKWIIGLGIVGILSSPFLSHTIKRHFPGSEVKQAWNIEYIARYGKNYERVIAMDKLKKYNGKYDSHPYIKHVKAEREKKLTEWWNKEASLEYLAQFKDPETRKKTEQWLITYYDAKYGATCKDLSPAARLRCFAATNQLKFRGKTKPSGVMY